ncbi:hypothetical protein MtrunA17_Chr1g0154051 [Medicago truncatula]|uniref:DUF630 family protein n=1 Tax=Medicago truncatula TaxID=3880 RepID=G7I4K1_MEDTR|nr:DUF630 family protein [Medicago truncatula]RHN77369.1 hypothetical protein MtrunA17_Chr1g0154051 [Medicago truncatula]
MNEIGITNTKERDSSTRQNQPSSCRFPSSSCLCTCHSDYCNSLRLTGSALSTFAASEPLVVSDDIPAVFVNTVKTHQQQPPPPATVTTTKLCTFSETCRLKLPHIFSDSSICSMSRSEFPNWFIPTAHQNEKGGE